MNPAGPSSTLGDEDAESWEALSAFRPVGEQLLERHGRPSARQIRGGNRVHSIRKAFLWRITDETS